MDDDNRFIEVLQNVFVENYKTKLIVLLLTFIIWGYIRLNNNYTTVISVPIEFTNIEKGKVFKKTPPREANIRCKGPGTDFFLLLFNSPQDFRLEIDLSNISWFYDFNLKEYFRNNPEQVISPKNNDIQMLSIVEPESLYVELDNVSSKTVPIQPNVNISLASGYTRYNDQIEPDSAKVKGPISYLNELNYVETKRFKKNKVQNSINTNIPLQDFGNKNIIVEPKKINYSLEIDQIVSKTVSGIPVDIRNKPEGINVKTVPSKVTLIISGGFQKMVDLNAEDINIYIDLRNRVNKDKISYEPEITTPEGIIDVEQVQPEEIEVRYIKTEENE